MSKRSIITVVSVLVSLAFASGMYAVASQRIQKDPAPAVSNVTASPNREAKKVLSRGVMSVAVKLSQAAKVSVPESARRQTYVASAYSDVLEKGLSQKDALYAAQEILKKFYPEAEVLDGINRIAAEYVVSQQSPQEQPKPEVLAVIDTLSKRITTDRHDLPWDGVIPKGDGKWTGTNPDSPRAGEWQRWAVSGVIVIPRPPANGSEEEKAELQQVRDAANSRTSDQPTVVERWLSEDGIDAPDVIWQDLLYEIASPDLPDAVLEADKAFAFVQKTLAMTMADSLMECWRVKYAYWTARPSTLDTSIKTLQADPNYPSFPSSHSAASAAAAQVLSVMIPTHKGEWYEIAEAASDSRLTAGVHFPIDNSAGFKLGELVAQQISSTLKLEKVY